MACGRHLVNYVTQLQTVANIAKRVIDANEQVRVAPDALAPELKHLAAVERELGDCAVCRKTWSELQP